LKSRREQKKKNSKSKKSTYALVMKILLNMPNKTVKKTVIWQTN